MLGYTGGWALFFLTHLLCERLVGPKVPTYASNHVLMGHMNEPESFIAFLPESHRIFMLLVLGWCGSIFGFGRYVQGRLTI